MREALALLFGLLALGLKSVSSSCGGRVTFLLRGQEKSNPKRRPPRATLSGHPAQKVREVRSGFSTAHPRAGEKESTIHVDSFSPAGPVDPTSPPHRDPVERRASCAHCL